MNFVPRDGSDVCARCGRRAGEHIVSRCPPSKDLWTIDDGGEAYPSYSAAVTAAIVKVGEERRSVNIYLNGTLYDTRRF